MLTRAFQIALLQAKLIVQERNTVIFMLLIPLLFTALVGWSTAGGNEEENAGRLVVADTSSGRLAEALVSHLQARSNLVVVPMSEAEVRTALADEEAEAALVIPADFNDRLLAGETADLQFLRAAEGNPEKQQLIEQAVRAALNELTGSLWAGEIAAQSAARLQLIGQANPNETAAYTLAAFEAAENQWQTGRPITLRTSQLSLLPQGSSGSPDGFGQSSPGMLVMFSLFFFLGGGIALIVERSEGTLPRLVMMPIHKASIVLGKLLATYFMGLVQMALLILAGLLFFGVQWGQSPAALLLVVLSYALAATGLGAVLGAFAQSAARASALLNVVVMAISALGGAWWPLEVVPEWMQTVGHFFPTAWAMDGFHDILTRGLGVTAVLPEVTALLGFAAVFLAVGIWRFRYEP
jgi:ABC-2 type transport system permease protein